MDSQWILYRIQSQGMFPKDHKEFHGIQERSGQTAPHLRGYGLSVEPDDRKTKYIYMLIASFHGKVLPGYEQLGASAFPALRL